MNADTIYLGAYGGCLATLFILNLVIGRMVRDARFLLINLMIAGLACFFILDKKSLSTALALSDLKTWSLTAMCPLLITIITGSAVIAMITNIKEASPKAARLLNLIVALQITAVLAFAAPTVMMLFGPPGMDLLIEAKLMPLGFAVLSGITTFGWLLSILTTPSQMGEWRAATLLGAVTFGLFLGAYSLVSYRLIALDPLISNTMRVTTLASLSFFSLALLRQSQFAKLQKGLAKSAQQSRQGEWADKQVSRQQINQAHLMQVLRREKELEAELRAREIEQMEALKAAKEAADEMARNKAQFLAIMSHEIRTPLNGIMGMVHLLMNTEVNEQQRDYIQTLNYSGDALLALVNDTLDISKIEAGQLVLESIDFDLQRLVSSIIMLMSARASEKNLLIRSDIDRNVPRFIKGDPTRLRQILLNLINNAIKFTEEGGVTVAVRLLSTTHDGSSHLRFEIQDTGPGISEEGRQRLFKEYSQVDASTTRLHGGTGLGLSICKQLVMAMEGEIGVDSKVGKGSTFWFVLDFEKSSGDTLNEMPGKTAGAPELSAMVVEDNEIHQKVIGGYLRLDGHSVTLVDNAEDALEQFEKRNFDMILMDVNLPGMDGNEATRRIRAHADRVKATVPIIAITGNTSPVDIDGCRAAGMDDFVGKPVDPDALRTTVFATYKAWKDRQQAGLRAAKSGTPVEARRNGLKILIVDDNQINQKVISGFLGGGGHQLVLAGSGEKAIALASETKFDLILMDVSLPGMDGMEASRRIRALADPALASVPIVAITGNTSESDVRKCRDAGMNDFVGKPIDPASLGQVIDRIRELNAGAPAGSTGKVSLDDYLPDQADSVQLLNEPILRRLIRVFDGKALSGLIDDMVKASLPLIDQMEQALSGGDMTGLRAHAHALKGMTMTLGMVGVGELAADIESSVQRGETSEILSGMLDRLNDVFAQSRAAIDQWRDRNVATAG
jgi:two-component system sensor histidine kinase/response regulator